MNCSSNECNKPGTRFDGSPSILACPEHETKWRNQMSELGVSSVEHVWGKWGSWTGIPTCIPTCGGSCSHPYKHNGKEYCFSHAPNNAVYSLISVDDNVHKYQVLMCSNNHKTFDVDNRTDKCWLCKEPFLKNEPSISPLIFININQWTN